jgi:hypothetical protein
MPQGSFPQQPYFQPAPLPPPVYHPPPQIFQTPSGLISITRVTDQNSLLLTFFFGFLLSIVVGPLFAMFALLCFSQRRAIYSIKAGVGVGWLLYAFIFIIVGGVVWGSAGSSYESCRYWNSYYSSRGSWCEIMFTQTLGAGQALFIVGVIALGLGVYITRDSYLEHKRSKPLMMGQPPLMYNQ